MLTYVYVNIRQLDEDALYDRCCGLRYNKKQLFVDRVFLVAGLWGFYSFGFYGLAQFGALSLFFTLPYNFLLYDRVPRMLRDRHDLPPESAA